MTIRTKDNHIIRFCYLRDNYYDRYLLDSPYNLCRDPLMRKGELTATSSAQQRGPEEVRSKNNECGLVPNSRY